MKKLPRLIIFFILYVVAVIFITYYSLPKTIEPREEIQGEQSKNIIEILRMAVKAVHAEVTTEATQLRNYLVLIFIASYLLFVFIQIYVKKIKWRYLILCPIGLMLFGFMLFEFIRILPGIGITNETKGTLYFILSTSMVISGFIGIRYMYHEVFTGKQKPKKIAIPRRHA